MLPLGSLIATLVVAALHTAFMVLESVLWDGPIGRKVFRMSAEQAAATKVLALNQGLYNLALAVLLTWAALMGHGPTAAAGLVFVVAMGIVGAATVSWRIIVLQSLPAVVALGLLWAGV